MTKSRFIIFKWTDEEIEILKKFYPTATYDELVKLLPRRTKNAIIAKASKLNVQKVVPVWSEDELKQLKKYYPSSVCNQELLAMFPGHSFVAIKTKAKLLGVKRGKYIPADREEAVRRWTRVEIDLVKDCYNTMDHKDLLKLLPGRSAKSLWGIAKKLNLGRKDFRFCIGEPWTTTEEKFLIENFDKLPNEKLMEFLNSRTLVAIKAMAQKLGLKRDRYAWASAAPNRPWKQDRKDLLVANWNKINLTELSKMLGNVSSVGLLKQAQKMGLPPYNKQLDNIDEK